MPVNFFSLLLLFLFLGAIFLFLSTFLRLILETCRSSQKSTAKRQRFLRCRRSLPKRIHLQRKPKQL